MTTLDCRRICGKALHPRQPERWKRLWHVVCRPSVQEKWPRHSAPSGWERRHLYVFRDTDGIGRAMVMLSGLTDLGFARIAGC